MISPRPASGLHKSPTNPAKQTLWTCVTPPQTPSQPCQANAQNLRYNPANQSPTGSSKSHGYSLRKPGAGQFQQITCVTCTANPRQPSHANPTDLRLGGAVTSCMRISARAAMATHAHGQCHARTAKVTPSRVCAYLHVHIFTAMARKPTRRDQRPAQQITNRSCPTDALDLRFRFTRIHASNRPAQTS